MKELLRIVRFTRELWPFYVTVSGFTVLLAAMSQLQPLFTKGVIDQVTRLIHGGHPDVTMVAVFALAIFITDLGQTLFSNISGYYGDILGAKIQSSMSTKYYAHLLELPQTYFDAELTGTIINRMNRGISQISDFIQTLSNNFLQFVFSTIFTLIIVAYYSWQVAVMLGVLYPLFVWLTTRSSERWQVYQKTINHEQDAASGRFAEVIGHVKVVKSYLQERREISIFSKHYATAVATTYPQSKYWHRQDIKRRLILNVIFFVMFAYIFIETAHGIYSLGTMVLLIQYAMLIRIPIFSISFLVDQTQRAITNTRDYFSVMDVQPDLTLVDGTSTLIAGPGIIEFKQVNFSYTAESPVLREVSFHLPAGTKTALVGESGQGKTTITSLLLRFYNTDNGAIYIDGQPVDSLTQASLRQAIAVVFQEPALFSGSIRDNIAYANPDASELDIIAAAKAANAWEFINKFPDALESQIGERGLKLSGGQKQRIAIARALLKNAPILVLDEATSSLDSKSEQLVQQALERLMHGRTTMIIAHRLSTITSVDQIITLKGGQVDEVGSPQQLADSGGIYSQLLHLQNQSLSSRKKKLQAYDLQA